MSLFIPPIATARWPRAVFPLATAATAAWQRIARFLEGWRHRHEARMLARADEHILADLGLSRADVSDAFSGPPWEDPTALLRARALERRLSRHRVAHGFPASAPTPSSQQGAFRRPPVDRPSCLTL